jgi:hypothetical protein
LQVASSPSLEPGVFQQLTPAWGPAIGGGARIILDDSGGNDGGCGDGGKESDSG